MVHNSSGAAWAVSVASLLVEILSSFVASHTVLRPVFASVARHLTSGTEARVLQISHRHILLRAHIDTLILEQVWHQSEVRGLFSSVAGGTLGLGVNAGFTWQRALRANVNR
jgi:hypothetical protein